MRAKGTRTSPGEGAAAQTESMSEATQAVLVNARTRLAAAPDVPEEAKPYVELLRQVLEAAATIGPSATVSGPVAAISPTTTRKVYKRTRFDGEEDGEDGYQEFKEEEHRLECLREAEEDISRMGQQEEEEPPQEGGYGANRDSYYPTEDGVEVDA